MDISLQKENFGFCSIILDKVVEQSVTAELNLPDYMPDILRVVKANMTAKINQVNLVGDRITVDGVCDAQIVYCCEAGELHTYSAVTEFSRYAECREALSTDTVTVKAVCDYANCRAISPKKAEIKGNISLPIKLIRKELREVLCGAQGAGIQLKTDNVSAVSIVAIGEKTFSMSDVFELPDGKDNIKSIIYSDAFAVFGEVKQISNKLMLKGELSVNVVYIPESKVTSVERISRSVPINQIIELEGISEGSMCDINLSVPMLEVTAKPKVDNTLRVIDISASVAALITAKEKKEVEIILDAYSTTNSVDIKKDTLSVVSLEQKVNETFVIKEVIDVSQNSLAGVLDIRIEEPSFSTSISETEITVSGTVKACIIYTDSAGEPAYMEKLIDFSNIYANKDGKAARFEPKITITASSFVVPSSEKIDLKIEASVSGNIYSEKKVVCINEIINEGERDKGVDPRGVTIYFAQENESLWSIARRYNTTIEAIVRENEIANDVLNEKQMLIIPSI